MGIARGDHLSAIPSAGIDVATAEEDRRRRGDLLVPQPVDGAGRAGVSVWQSVARGKAITEADYLNGEIVLLAAIARVCRPHQSPDPAAHDRGCHRSAESFFAHAGGSSRVMRMSGVILPADVHVHSE